MMSTVIIFTLTFAALGLLLGISASYDIMHQIQLPSDGGERNPDVQAIMFERCTNEAKSDGVLTEEEYFECAYGIYD